jgi:ribosome assembly protein YihI (activator of Der GTPase)
VQVDTDAPTQFVIAKNLHRRHLDTSQRATIAAEMVALLREEAHQRQIAGLKQFEAKNEQNPNKSPLWPNGRNGESREIAAEALNVSARTVQRAMMVKRHDPALFEKVKKGEIPVNTAAREVDRQKQNLTGRESIRANVHKRRMEQGLSTMRITCTCLNESLDVSRALSACDQSEVDHWLKVIEEVVKGLGLFSKTLTF